MNATLGQEEWLGDVAYYACSTDGDDTPDEWVSKDEVWNQHGGQVKWNAGIKHLPDDDDLNIDPSLEDLLDDVH